MINYMGGGGRVEVISSKGCSRLFAEISTSIPSFRGYGLQSCSLQHIAPASTASAVPDSAAENPAQGPFSGLVICVTGLSKEARKQVMDAAEKLGGEYSPHLHPQCTHLVVQSFHGRKFEHALKHGPRNGLFVVTLGWFVDSVKRNVRLSESIYSIRSAGEVGMPIDDLNGQAHSSVSEKSCLPSGSFEFASKSDTIDGQLMNFPERDSKRRNMKTSLSGYSFYIDTDVSAELQSKVVEAVLSEGAILVGQWYVGCSASHVVCDGHSAKKYLGHSSNLVTPLWVLKTAKERHLQRLVQISADLARQTATALDAIQADKYDEDMTGAVGLQDTPSSVLKASHEERKKIANLAKEGVRKRRNRHMQLQTCQTPIRPITPHGLLDCVCWSISEPTSSATIYTDCSSIDDANEQNSSVFFDARTDGKESESSFVNLSRPLTESEKSEIILKIHYLTVLFPVDRFSEIGPCSRSFFNDKGFTCLQVLDYIHAFYQENMSTAEIEVAIHSDSKHADRLRSIYSSEETGQHGLQFKRIDFLGSRISFDMLKRVPGDNNSNVYELLIRA